MTARRGTRGEGGPAAARWSLEPLLSMRAAAEERAGEAVGRAVAAWRGRSEEARRGEAALARVLAAARAASSPGELLRAARFRERIEEEARAARCALEEAMAGLRAAQAAHARSRADREALEGERERWRAARAKARGAALEGELDDLGAARRATQH